MKVKEPFPSIWEAIGMTFLIILFLYVFTFIAYLIIPSKVPQTAIFLGTYTLAMGTSVLLFRKFQKDKNTHRHLVLFQKIDIKVVVLIIISTLALDNGTLMLSHFIPISDAVKEGLMKNFGNLDAFMLVVMMIGAPIFEEILFRGIMLDGLLKKHSSVLAIGLSSVLFGVMHLNPLQFFSATIHGFFLGWIYYQSKNLTYCLLIHFIINLVGYLMIKQVGIENMFSDGIVEIYGGRFNAAIIFVLSSIVFIFCLRMLYQFFEKQQKYSV